MSEKYQTSEINEPSQQDNFNSVDQENLDIEDKIDLDPDVIQAFSILEAWRKAPDSRSEAELVEAVKQARDTARRKLDNGESTQNEIAELKTRHANIQTIIKSINGDESENEVLHKLGFLDSEDKFTFPETIFSLKAQRLYNEYIHLVKLWVDANEKSALLGADVAEMQFLEKARVTAHNRATQQIYEEVNGALDFQEVRRLIAKMRDMIVPNSKESQKTAVAAKEALEKAARDILERQKQLDTNSSSENAA